MCLHTQRENVQCKESSKTLLQKTVQIRKTPPQPQKDFS